MAIFNRLTELAACLCAEYVPGNVNDLPQVCFCGVVSGEQAAIDYFGDCDTACGMAWVRLTSASPMSGIGIENVQPGNCGSTLGFSVEVGVSRCANFPDSDGTPPSEADYRAEVELQYADMLAMRRAIVCCQDTKNYILGTYTPYGPTGASVGGLWNLTMLDD